MKSKKEIKKIAKNIMKKDHFLIVGISEIDSETVQMATCVSGMNKDEALKLLFMAAKRLVEKPGKEQDDAHASLSVETHDSLH